jgi:hypothetical protein
MKLVTNTASILLIVVVAATGIPAEHNARIAENAALRYWSAFSEVQDFAITAQQAKELNAILDGTAPYDDSRYQDLIKKNELALEIMFRGTSLQNCDWGLDYGLGSQAPVEYARKALMLGRLNVLYALHLLKTKNIDGAVHALTAGIRFSHDVGNGGSLFATIVSKSLLTDHLRAITGALRLEHLNAGQRSQLQTAVAGLGQGLDWSSAAKRDLEALRRNHTGSSQMSAALSRITDAYVAALSDESNVPAVNQALESAPKDLANLIPNIGSVLKQKQDLIETIRRTRSVLQ